MKTPVTLIPGDGIGPEVTYAAVRLLDAAGAEIEWVEKEAKPMVGQRVEDWHADPVVASILSTRVGLKGPITT
ncbi:MAG: NAD-dependent isocitrate dehydrogenase, partial [Acidobacteria bacterium]|nr:NAD-dependent isocitrate dehydrogenase [Acidobacteriota bacterium]